MRILIFLLFTSFLWGMDECKTCHNVEHFDKINHDFSCKACHILPNVKNPTHDDVIANPSENLYVDKFCSKCHKEQIQRCKNSNHFTHKNEIKTVLKAFNMDGNYTLQTLPNPKTIHSREDLVYDMLRRKCLKCHVGNDKFYENGSPHGKGCMACHIKYSLSTKSPHPLTHKLAKKPPLNACLSCHNKEFIGTDYLGMFPKDYDKSYRGEVDKKGRFKPQIYGIDYHYLKSDVHSQNSLACADCHKYESISQDKNPTCKTCHKIKPNEAHATYHENISCTACHASWQMSNYELSLYLDETKNFSMWDRLKTQEDGFVKNILSNPKYQKSAPKMPDAITGKMKKGVWYSGWGMRRWENLLLGNDKNGKVKILRPMFEYRLTYKNAQGKVVYDDLHMNKNGTKIEAFTPYSPHTIGKYAKSCEACHENPLLLEKNGRTDTILDSLKGRVIKGTPLSKKQLDRLTSKKYKKIKAKMLLD